MTAGLYIHIPYCKRKCGYCGFVSYPLSCCSVPDTFIDALLQEMALYSSLYGRQPVDTVFIGGGTPSLLSPAQITRVLAGARTHFQIADDAEITCEANPDSLSEDVLQAMRGGGVNRLSIGAQSLDDTLLQTLGRIHDSSTFLAAYERAVNAGFSNINVDLMFGLPGQSYTQWTQTLHQITDLAPAHLSLYTIQIEEGTPFYDAYKDGQIDLPPLAEDRRMYHDAVRTLKQGGWEHYEISNFAKPGMACRHNLKYWSMDPFIGIGPSAASYYESCRYQNAASLDDWMKMIADHHLAKDAVKSESLDDAIEVFCFTALRTAEGLDEKRFLKRFGMTLEDAYRSEPLPFDEWTAQGLLRREDGRIVLTETGIDISNEIMSAFMRG